MTNENETVEQVCECVEYLAGTDGGGLEIFGEHINSISLADRILAAHKREIAAKDEEIKTLRKLVYGLLEAATVDCATCCYDYCGPNRENCIVHEAAMYIEESEAKND